jgi:hypothetical protein
VGLGGVLPRPVSSGEILRSEKPQSRGGLEWPSGLRLSAVWEDTPQSHQAIADTQRGHAELERSGSALGQRHVEGEEDGGDGLVVAGEDDQLDHSCDANLLLRLFLKRLG